MKRLLGVDVGSSSIKLGFFDLSGRLVHLWQRPYRMSHPRAGWAEIDPVLWWTLIREGLRESLAAPVLEDAEICSVGISSLCPALIAVDERLESLHPAIVYYDQRSVRQAARIATVIPEEEFFRVSGNRIMPGTCSLTSILFLKDTENDLYSRTRYFGHGNSYIAARLTGSFFLDRTNASYTGVYNTRSRGWAPELIKALRLDANKFPPVLLSSEPAGRVSKAAARETGLKEGTPVAIGAADTACSALSLDVTREGDLFESSGTSDVLTLCQAEPLFNRNFLNRCHAVDERWLVHGAMSTPGAALKWLAGILGFEEPLVSREADASAPGAGGLLFLPYMSGERTPVWDSRARGVFFGLSLNTQSRDLIRAQLEGVGFGLRQILELMSAEFHVSGGGYRIVGGGAQIDAWNQIKADILERNIEACDFQETAVLGASILGGMAAGLIPDLEDFLSGLRWPSRVFLSRPAHHTLYRRHYEIYCSLYPALKDSFAALNPEAG